MGLCGKTTVFLHEPFTRPSLSQPACLRFNILVQKNNVRETRSDMSKADRSQITWVRPDILGLFLDNPTLSTPKREQFDKGDRPCLQTSGGFNASPHSGPR